MILVTGGSGVLGRALITELEKKADPVYVVNSDAVDLRNTTVTNELFGDLRPRLVYHLAAKVFGLGGNANFPGEMFLDNIRINTNVVEGARLAACSKIVGVSTVAIYSSDVPRPTRETSIWMGPPHGSEASYGHAKRAMLAHLQANAKQYGTQFAYPIMTNIYGEHDRFDVNHGHVVPSLIAKFHRATISDSAVEVWGAGTAERDFINSEDAARALVEIGENVTGEINVATGSTVSIRQIVEILSEHTGIENIVWDRSKPEGQLERLYDVTRLRELHFEPKVDIREGLIRTFEWYKANYPNVRC